MEPDLITESGEFQPVGWSEFKTDWGTYMATIHLGDGEKGGVGKSLFVRTFIQYRLERGLPFVAVETDRSNPDVAGIYKDLCQYAVFTEDEKQADKADRIFEMAIEKPVIINLAAQSHRAVKGWIEKNQLFELGREYKVGFCKWFVTNGGYDSLKLFTQSLTSYESKMQHILVRNWGMCDDWEHVEGDKALNKLIKKYKVLVIDFPKLAYRERNLIDQKRLRFDEALQDKEITIVGRQRVANFLKAAYAAFDKTGVAL
ncbi:mobilization protein MobD-like protein [Merismopedia glauca]|nr:mobilization protein MobD-like protein [Merismopedia glauca]